MPIVLTDSLKYCPCFPERRMVTMKTIKNFNNNTDVIAAFCSRGMAKIILNLTLPNLKVIQLFSAGYDGIDLEIVRKKGIALCNAANVYNIGMAEFVVHAMLMRAKRYHHNIHDHSVRLFRNYHYITELYGRTVGIMGCGNIGSQIAKRLSAFDMRVIGYDVNTNPRQGFEQIYGLNERDSFVPQCDYIVCCLPLIPSTKGILNKDWFALMKETVTIVNVARQHVICDKDFIHFLKGHHNVIAILDMLEKIPNPLTNPYRRLTNVLVLPGVTAASLESMDRLHLLLLQNLDNIKENKPLINVVNGAII